jgi:hypothetical protein
MRLSTSPFPFDLTAASVDVPAGAAPALAPGAGAAGATTGGSSFGDLLQAETTPTAAPATAATPTSPGAAAVVSPPPATLAGMPAAVLVANAGRSRCLFAPSVTPLAPTLPGDVASDTATIGTAGSGEAADGAEDATAAAETPRPAADASHGDAQAQLAVLAMLVGMVPNTATAADEPAIENLELTVDGETYVSTGARSESGESTVATGPGPVPATLPTAGFVRSAYAASGGSAAPAAGEREANETQGVPPAVAVQPRAADRNVTSLPQPPAAMTAVTARNASRSAATHAGQTVAAPGAALPASAPDQPALMPPATKAADSSSSPLTALARDGAGVGQPGVNPSATPTLSGAVAGPAVPTASRSLPANTPGALPLETLTPDREIAADAAIADWPDRSKPAGEAAEADPIAAAPVLATGPRATGSVATTAREKIAVPSGRQDSATAGRQNGEQKQSLGSGDQPFTSDKPALGTNTAKTKAPMPASASTPAPSTRLDEPLPGPTAPLSFDALVKEAATAAPGDLSRAAHRAVDSALAMAEHFNTTGAQRGVSLQFSVSGVDLAVRVEMRADGVHTFFRTDSPELRTALAQEWQSVVAAQPAESGQRLVDPVFTSTPGGSSTSSGSDTAGHRQSADAQRQPASEAGTPRSLPGHGTRRATAVVSAPPAAVRPITLSTVRHLHTFA